MTKAKLPAIKAPVVQRSGVGGTDFAGVDSGLGEVMIPNTSGIFTVDDRAGIGAIEQPKLTRHEATSALEFPSA